MHRAGGWLLGLFAFALLFAPIIAIVQVRDMRVADHTSLSNGGLQYRHHRDVIEDKAVSPWRYRVLPEYLIAGLIKVFDHVRPAKSAPLAFVSLRVAQLFLILFLSGAYLKSLKIDRYARWVGLGLLVYTLSTSNRYSDLQANTYFDLIAYLCAALLILHDRLLWLLPLMVLAAMNRETSGLIPLMLGAYAIWLIPPGAARRRALMLSAACLAAFTLTYLSIRQHYGSAEIFVPYNHPPGLSLLKYNLITRNTYTELLTSFSIFPLIGLLAMRRAPGAVRAFFWAIVPIWIMAHLMASVWAETRLFLVPFVLVFLPAVVAGFGAAQLPGARRDAVEDGIAASV